MLPIDKQERKNRPIFRGVLRYFPDAIAEVAYVSQVGNAQHHPGEELHWDRSKSWDHEDCIARHLMDAGKVDTDGLRHSAKVAWRALALLQLELEAEAKPLPYEEKIKAKMEAALGPIDPGKPFYSKITPLMYAASHTDAREAAVPPEAPGQCLNCPEKIGLEGCCREVKDPVDERPAVYIAGPMRGYADFNFPAFDAAREVLEALGYRVISPADMDRVDPRPREEETLPQHVYAARDTDALIDLAKNNPTGENAIYMLHGWNASQGAIAEHFLAEWLGLKIVYQEVG